ncbi:hypothetical protein ACFLWM_01910 [Chloroflexota bacterium]
MVNKTMAAIKKKQIFIGFLISIGLLTMVALPALGAPDATETASSEQVSHTQLVNGEPNESSNAPGDPTEYEFTLIVGKVSMVSSAVAVNVSVVHNGKSLGGVNIGSDEVFGISCPEGTVITLNAHLLQLPHDGEIYPVFKNWLGDIGENSAASTSITITMDSDKVITAHYDDSFLLQASPSPPDGGTVVFPSDNHFYLRDHEVTLTASAAKGYRFDHWESIALRSGSSNSNPIIIKMDYPKRFVAFFKRVEIGPEPKGARGSLPWELEEDSKVATGLFLQEEHERITPLEETPPELRLMPWRTSKAVKAAAGDLPQQPEEALDVEDEETEAEVTPTSLKVNLNTISHSIADESGCTTQVRIDTEATDTSGGSKPIVYIQLYVDGEEYSSTDYYLTPTEHTQQQYLLASGCSEVRVLQLTATNDSNQTETAAKEIRIPPLSTHFTYDIQDATGEGDCQVRLSINYQAVDLSTPENPITNVVVKANGETWHNSGSISSLQYENSFNKLVGCGQTFRVEVIGTDTDGNTYTYRETINTPEEEPPPPPPQTTLYSAMAANAQCTAAGPECSCQLSISFNGKDLTNGDYPVTHVVLRVNGQIWHDSGSISTTLYNHVEQRTVNCGETFNIEVTVNNTLGQTVTSTGSLTTPVP